MSVGLYSSVGAHICSGITFWQHRQINGFCFSKFFHFFKHWPRRNFSKSLTPLMKPLIFILRFTLFFFSLSLLSLSLSLVFCPHLLGCVPLPLSSPSNPPPFLLSYPIPIPTYTTHPLWFEQSFGRACSSKKKFFVLKHSLLLKGDVVRPRRSPHNFNADPWLIHYSTKTLTFFYITSGFVWWVKQYWVIFSIVCGLCLHNQDTVGIRKPDT